MFVRTYAVVLSCLGVLATVPATAVTLVDTKVQIASDGESEPTWHTGDSADDPAIWVDRANPGQSLVIGNDKRGALEIYDLSGSRVQRITSTRPFWGNVDVRQRVRVGDMRYDVVAAMNRGLRLYAMDPDLRTLSTLTSDGRPIRTGGGEGLCLYDPVGSDVLYAFVVDRDGRVRQFKITDNNTDGTVESTRVRQFSLGSEGEGCVADDGLHRVHISQEDFGLWRYDADPNGGATRHSVDKVGGAGHLVSDVEGVTLALTGRTGMLIVSAQNVARPRKSYFVAYTRRGNDYIASFRIVDGADSDGCQRTDGVAAYAGKLGPDYPQGLFVCQDHDNRAPGVGHQDFKFTRLEKIITLRD